MKIFGRNIRYSPEETAEAKTKAVANGTSLRKAAKIRAYIVTTEYDCFEKYRITHGFWQVVKTHLVLGFGYLFCRLKEGCLNTRSRIPHPPETYRRPGQTE
jgi:hypothetical protein